MVTKLLPQNAIPLVVSPGIRIDATEDPHPLVGSVPYDYVVRLVLVF
jgi:hypothetical protein